MIETLVEEASQTGILGLETTDFIRQWGKAVALLATGALLGGGGVLYYFWDKGYFDKHNGPANLTPEDLLGKENYRKD